VRAVRRDGTVLRVDCLISRIVWRGEDAALITVLDVTERAHGREAVRQAQKMEAVGLLAGGIAHDFNNLLTVITGNADLLLRAVGPQTTIAKVIREIKTAAASAALLTRQLLTFSRRQFVQLQPVDVNGIVRRVESLLRRVIGEEVTLALRLTPAATFVTADPGHIEQTIMNLVINARDAMSDGGDLIVSTAIVALDRTSLSGHPEVSGPHVALAITDTGHGMDAATQSHLFEPFFTTKEAGKGTGLGLATVREIVRQSRGHISVVSSVGKGSTFTVYLPLVAAAPVPVTIPEPTTLTGGVETVLVLEDQREPRSVVCEALRRHGYTVLDAASGEEALAKSLECDGRIHLLVTDVVMSGLSGRQVALLLEQQRPEVRVIYMSGYPNDVVLRHGAIEGAVAFLQKPFSVETLLSKVRGVLDARHPPRL
jgi:signal transduction histidine kinase/ActR/RegA family two-component response regulator